ncbi:MAG: BamA/TamA family outer membrane protein [Alphaproteobacteria bacterium]|nr:BamA/TamA family outer membrane protein [Alphaproteobacteria bacterium]
MRFKSFVFSAALISAFLFAGSAHAQLEQQTGIADPGRTEQRLTEERLIPQAGPDVSVKELVLQQAPEGAEDIKFNFGGLQLNGVSTYSHDQLYKLYGDMIGTEISLADLYAIANRMTLKYRNDGYVLTQVVVPPQTIENGIAELQIVEGFIDSVIIQGGDNSSSSELKLIQQYASRINTSGALNISDMERYLLLINDLPGLSARSVISPSATTAGAADLLVIIERDPFEALIGANNHGSRFLGPYQFSGQATLNSVLGFNEAITAQVVAAPDSGMELAFGSITYEQPIGPWGTTAALTGSITDTDPGYTLSPFEVEGLSKSISFEIEHPVIRSRNTNIFTRLGFDWRNVDSKNNVELTRRDRIRAVRAGVQADFLDRLLGVAVNTIDLQISQGVNILGASEEGDANMTRASGDPTFTKGNIEVQRLQRVTSSVNVLLSGKAQLSNNPLLSSEEFGVGGISTVRGYDPSEVVGDDGIAGKVELQWNTPIKETKIVKDVQAFGFFDSGRVWNQDPTNAGDKRNSVTSTGGGLRFDLPLDVAAEFVVAKPLHRDIQTKRNRDVQYFFSLNKEF